MRILKDKYDVIIIGCGMGGLGSGIMLQTENSDLKTIIFEQHNIPGGYVTGFKRKGYYFDGGAEGITSVGENGLVKKALTELGIDYEFIPIEPLDVYYFDDKKFNFYLDKEKLIKEVKRVFPKHLDGFKEFLAECDRIFQEISSGNKIPEYDNLCYLDLIGKFVPNDYIKDVFNLFCLWYGAKPSEMPGVFGAMVTRSVMNGGVYYPKGGMQEFSNMLRDTYTSRGGEVVFSTMVKKILIEDNKVIGVELENGKRIKCDWLISNADIKRTILEYSGEKYFPKEYVDFIKNLKLTPSGFMLHLGVEMDLSNYPSHFQIGKDYAILEKTSKGQFKLSKLAVRIPANIDPDLKNGDNYSIVVFMFAPYDWKDYWLAGPEKDRGIKYKEYKEQVADEVISIIEKVIPGLREKIAVKELATPLTFERYLQVTEGAWFGSHKFQKLPDSETPIDNLLLVGASVRGSGAPSALNHGFTVGDELAKKIS